MGFRLGHESSRSLTPWMRSPPIDPIARRNLSPRPDTRLSVAGAPSSTRGSWPSIVNCPTGCGATSGRKSTTPKESRRSHSARVSAIVRKEDFMALLSRVEAAEKLALLPDWRLVGETIERTLTFADFPAAMAFVNRVAEAAEKAGHHPDIDIRW